MHIISPFIKEKLSLHTNKTHIFDYFYIKNSILAKYLMKHLQAFSIADGYFDFIIINV